ncbi:MAG: hypothetical protein QF578_21140 [Alphaproteobacteria bacterium]|jgi:hypothetical protein|nr:hypothetical protein [Alphaproteobacteria bacterium]MDP6567348.1 hypothetical protein [Alphaproteobacteria bacterium]MDP6815981.1 hypothetical protein [Alphaproteobacteria bacterium]
MLGIVIEYDFDGDEATWADAVETFVKAIDDDPRLRGRFSYQVNVRADGGGRIHVGRWDEEETLAHLQSQDFFKTFAAKVQEFGGDSLKATRYKRLNGTSARN